MLLSFRMIAAGCVGVLVASGCKDPAPAVDAEARRPRAAKIGKTEAVGKVRWGTSDLVKNVPEESAPTGPSAFVVDPAGKAHILDRAASRVQVYAQKNGRWLVERTVALPPGEYIDLETDGASGYALLDADDRQAVIFVDGSGKETASLRLAGAHIPEVGYVRALRLRGSEVWVQLADYSLVLIGEGTNAVAERTVQKGLDNGGGKRLVPVVKRPNDVRVGFLGGDTVGALATLSFDLPVARISALEVAPDGSTYVAVVLEEDPKPGGAQGRVEHLLVVIDAKGNEVVRANLEVDESGLGCNRPLRLGADGKLYQMRLSDDGVDLTRFVR